MKTLSIRNVLAVLVVGTLLGTAYFTNSGLFKAPVAKASASQNVSGYAWSENIGWISLNSTSDGSAISYGVNISPLTGTGIFSGKAWSENIGWISFDSADLTGCPSGACNAQVDWSTGKVTGWARALANGSGWDGWIKLSDDSVGVWNGKGVSINLTDGKFSGYAWGGGDSAGVAGVVGWIDFAPKVNGTTPIPNPAQGPIPLVLCDPVAGPWGVCTNSTATCTTPPDGATKVVSGTQYCTDINGTISNPCSTAIITCTAPTPAQTKTHFWQF